MTTFQLKVKEVPTRIRYDVPKGSRYTALSHGFTVFKFRTHFTVPEEPLCSLEFLESHYLQPERPLVRGSSERVGDHHRWFDFVSWARFGRLLGWACWACHCASASLVLHGARRLMRRLLIEEFGMD